MQNSPRLSHLTFAIAFGLMLLPATGADSVRVGAYDFSYASTGDTRARPVQVFDDGRSTFFQFRAGDAVPAIFSHQGGTPQLLVPTQEGPYIRVAELHGRFVLQVGRAQANVVHAGGGRQDAPPLNVVTASGLANPYSGGPGADGSRLVASFAPIGLGTAIDDAANRNSYATPRKGDAVTWVDTEPKRSEFSVMFAKGSAALTPEGRKVIASVAKMDGPQSHVVVIGRDDESLKEGLDRLRADTLKAALVKAGVDPTRLTTRVGVAGTPIAARWPSTLQVETERPAPSRTLDPRLATIRANLDALVKAGVLRPDQAQAIAVQHGAKATAPATATAAEPVRAPFTLTASDKTLQNTLRRWAQQANFQLVWAAPAALDAPILGEASIPGATIQEALERLLVGLKEKGYALDATVFSNRVIRLTPAASVTRPGPDAVVPAATPASSVPPKVEPKPAQPRSNLAQPAHWQMLQGDRTVQNMLARWAADAQGTVAWNAGERVAIVGDAVINSPSLRGAAEQVISQATAAGYRLRLTSTDERNLVVSSY